METIEEPQDTRPVHCKLLSIKLTLAQWRYINEKAHRRQISMSAVVRGALSREMRRKG